MYILLQLQRYESWAEWQNLFWHSRNEVSSWALRIKDTNIFSNSKKNFRYSATVLQFVFRWWKTQIKLLYLYNKYKDYFWGLEYLISNCSTVATVARQPSVCANRLIFNLIIEVIFLGNPLLSSSCFAQWRNHTKLLIIPQTITLATHWLTSTCKLFSASFVDRNA